MYLVVLRKCTEVTKNRLEGESKFEDIDKASDVIKFLELIMSILYAFESN